MISIQSNFFLPELLENLGKTNDSTRKKLDKKIGQENWTGGRGKLDSTIFGKLDRDIPAPISDPGTENWIPRLEPKSAHELVRSLQILGWTLDFRLRTTGLPGQMSQVLWACLGSLHQAPPLAFPTISTTFQF